MGIFSGISRAIPAQILDGLSEKIPARIAEGISGKYSEKSQEECIEESLKLFSRYPCEIFW